jgi:hypothetical protein
LWPIGRYYLNIIPEYLFESLDRPSDLGISSFSNVYFYTQKLQREKVRISILVRDAGSLGQVFPDVGSSATPLS